MPKRLRALLKGTEDAVPADYVFALIAVFAVMFMILLEMLI